MTEPKSPADTSWVSTTEPKRWLIPRPVFTILLSWGLGVLMISGLLSYWVWSNQRQQDEDMCTLIRVFIDGPAPVPGPAGDRSRKVQKAMEDYSHRRDCPSPK